jgi:hypothetical protein
LLIGVGYMIVTSDIGSWSANVRSVQISLKQGFGLERISVERLKWWSDPFKLSERLDQVVGEKRHFAAIPSTFANAAYVNR